MRVTLNPAFAILPSTPAGHPTETLRYLALEGVSRPARPPRRGRLAVPFLRRFRRRRRLDAERRFFDAYGRGGDRDPRDLALAADFFVAPDVARALAAWDGGAPLDAAAIDAAAARETGGDARAAENVTHFLALLGEERRVSIRPIPAPR